jgi:hypothetical protein
MSTWDRIRAVLRREKRDLDDVLGDAQARANAALDRRERELNATPAERFEMERERAAEVDAEYEAAKRRIEGNDPGAST